MADHVHLFVSWSKERSVADVLRVVKTNSSKWIHETFPDQATFAWQSGYGAFAVSQSNAPQVERYLANQKEHHRKLSFKDEFIALLKKHGIPYDERYVWNDETVT
jgi:REP element-mobilizing transposase RayT